MTIKKKEKGKTKEQVKKRCVEMDETVETKGVKVVPPKLWKSEKSLKVAHFVHKKNKTRHHLTEQWSRATRGAQRS